jgi:P-type conjugative transfer protein TrbG
MYIQNATKQSIVQKSTWLFLIGGGFLLAGCAPKVPSPRPLTMHYHLNRGQISSHHLTYQVATQQTEPANTHIVYRYVPVPLPGQLMTLDSESHKNADNTEKKENSVDTVNAANTQATQTPRSANYINAIASFPYMDGALYQVYTAPLKVTDIELAPGEKLSSVVGGDTLRWQLQTIKSSSGDSGSTHIIVKPMQADLESNIVIITDKHAYHISLQSKKDTYMASVKWNYPSDNININSGAEDTSGQTAVDRSLPPVNMNKLNFNYQLYLMKGHQPVWTPKSVFNDGQKTYIQFPAHLQRMPILFVASLSSKGKKLVQPIDYRKVGDYFIIDQIFRVGELQLGQTDGSAIQIVYRSRN